MMLIHFSNKYSKSKLMIIFLQNLPFSLPLLNQTAGDSNQIQNLTFVSTPPLHNLQHILYLFFFLGEDLGLKAVNYFFEAIHIFFVFEPNNCHKIVTPCPYFRIVIANIIQNFQSLFAVLLGKPVVIQR